MDETTLDAVRGQFGASLDSLGLAMDACPPALWNDRASGQAFGDHVFHVLFWLDFYLAESPATFAPPAPFGVEEMDPAGVLPPQVHAPDALHGYLAHVRARVRAALAAFAADPAAAAEVKHLGNTDLSALEWLLYNLRHVQHHVGQLQMLLRQHGVEPPRWVRRGAD